MKVRPRTTQCVHGALIGRIQTLFLWILKSSDFGISTISSDSQSKMSQESKKIRSRDRRIFEKNPYYEIKTLTHNNVKTVSDKRNWTGSSDSACDLLLLTEVWWRHDYVIWRNYEKSIFWTWAILESLIRQVSTYAHVSNWNFNANSVRIKFFGFAYTNFLKRDFLLNA